MPRKIRIEYPGAIHHIMSRGNRREDIFHDEVDRHDFLKTVAEACFKADFQVHACLRQNHSGELRRESAEAKAERIINEELRRLGWAAADLSLRRKSDPAKLAMADRLRRETVLTVKAIAERLHLGSPKSARARLRERKQTASSLDIRTAQSLN